jgi:hypothetical protein
MAKRAEHGKDLKALEGEFKAWRRKRSRGTRIPEQLWASAISATRVHGLWKISKRLRLDYYALRKRCEAQATGAGAAAVAGGEINAAVATPVAEFVELPRVVDRGPECLLELEDERGTALRVGLRGVGVQQLETAARLLWELGR